jgi:hypothetical protein
MPLAMWSVTGRAVVDEKAGVEQLELGDPPLSGRHGGHRRAAAGSEHGVEVHVVGHSGRVAVRDADLQGVALSRADERARNAPVECPGTIQDSRLEGDVLDLRVDLDGDLCRSMSPDGRGHMRGVRDRARLLLQRPGVAASGNERNEQQRGGGQPRQLLTAGTVPQLRLREIFSEFVTSHSRAYRAGIVVSTGPERELAIASSHLRSRQRFAAGEEPSRNSDAPAALFPSARSRRAAG